MASAPNSKHLILEITGACSDNIIIRDNATLIGTGSDANDSISFDGTAVTTTVYRQQITNAITVIGAHNIVINNLTVSDALLDNFSAGLRLFNGASALVRNSIFENNQNPLWVNQGSVLQMNGNTVRNNIRYSLLVTDGNVVDILARNDLSGATTIACVGIYRHSSARFTQGTNTITSTANDALQVFQSSHFRSGDGILTINGEISIGFLSQLDFRDTIVNGNLQIDVQSQARLLSRDGDGFTMTGNISLDSLSYLQLGERGLITGNITCNGFGPTILINAASTVTASTVTGTTDVACNSL